MSFQSYLEFCPPLLQIINWSLIRQTVGLRDCCNRHVKTKSIKLPSAVGEREREGGEEKKKNRDQRGTLYKHAVHVTVPRAGRWNRLHAGRISGFHNNFTIKASRPVGPDQTLEKKVFDDNCVYFWGLNTFWVTKTSSHRPLSSTEWIFSFDCAKCFKTPLHVIQCLTNTLSAD